MHAAKAQETTQFPATASVPKINKQEQNHSLPFASWVRLGETRPTPAPTTRGGAHLHADTRLPAQPWLLHFSLTVKVITPPGASLLFLILDTVPQSWRSTVASLRTPCCLCAQHRQTVLTSLLLQTPRLTAYPPHSGGGLRKEAGISPRPHRPPYSSVLPSSTPRMGPRP